jgi:hypothetical protein
MDALHLLGAALTLFVTLGVGTVAHEYAHAAVLSLAGIPYETEWLPDREGNDYLRTGAFGTWASVTPRDLPNDTSPWLLRASALMPLTLATPFALVAVGVLPDPAAVGDPYLVTAAVAWFACALPSPQDFSLVWYAERAIAEA